MSEELKSHWESLANLVDDLRLHRKHGTAIPDNAIEGLADLVDEIRPAMLGESKPGTVRARIAVAVSDKGDWSSCGWKNCPNDQEAETMAFETLDYMGSQVVHFIEADVPLPVRETIQAESVQPVTGGRG